MIFSKLYFMFTGLYFSVLQFSYFLVLQLNVSSTYITYMVVVLAWMLGTVVGLWWTKLNTVLIGLLGGIAYYFVFLLVSVSSLSIWTLTLASVGVFISGLWAGRFFVHYFTRVPDTDKLFFHENNGFLIGIIITVIGFAQYGKLFLMWSPLFCATLLVSLQISMKKYGASAEISDLNN